MMLVFEGVVEAVAVVVVVAEAVVFAAVAVVVVMVVVGIAVVVVVAVGIVPAFGGVGPLPAATLIFTTIPLRIMWISDLSTLAKLS